MQFLAERPALEPLRQAAAARRCRLRRRAARGGHGRSRSRGLGDGLPRLLRCGRHRPAQQLVAPLCRGSSRPPARPRPRDAGPQGGPSAKSACGGRARSASRSGPRSSATRRSATTDRPRPVPRPELRERTDPARAPTAAEDQARRGRGVSPAALWARVLAEWDRLSLDDKARWHGVGLCMAAFLFHYFWHSWWFVEDAAISFRLRRARRHRRGLRRVPRRGAGWRASPTRPGPCCWRPCAWSGSRLGSLPRSWVPCSVWPACRIRLPVDGAGPRRARWARGAAHAAAARRLSVLRGGGAPPASRSRCSSYCSPVDASGCSTRSRRERPRGADSPSACWRSRGRRRPSTRSCSAASASGWSSCATGQRGCLDGALGRALSRTLPALARLEVLVLRLGAAQHVLREARRSRPVPAVNWEKRGWAYLRNFALESGQGFVLPVYLLAMTGVRGWRGIVGAVPRPAGDLAVLAGHRVAPGGAVLARVHRARVVRDDADRVPRASAPSPCRGSRRARAAPPANSPGSPCSSRCSSPSTRVATGLKGYRWPAMAVVPMTVLFTAGVAVIVDALRDLAPERERLPASPSPPSRGFPSSSASCRP